MITYIEAPLRGVHSVSGHDILVVAFFLVADYPRLIYVADDGSMGTAEIGEVNINWRFDDRDRKWLEVDTGEELAEREDGYVTD